MLKNDLSLVMEKIKRIHEVTKINNRRKEVITKKLSSSDGDVKVDDKRKSDRRWFQYLGIQHVHFVKETTEKDGIESTSNSKSSKKCFDVLINTTTTIDDLKRIIIINQSCVPLIFKEIKFCYEGIEINNDNPNKCFD